jgi:hypothetical protein
VEYVGTYAHPGEGWEIPIVFMSGLMAAAVVEHVLHIAFKGAGHSHGAGGESLEAAVPSGDSSLMLKGTESLDSKGTEMEEVGAKQISAESNPGDDLVNLKTGFWNLFFSNTRYDQTLPSSTGYVILIGDCIHSKFVVHLCFFLFLFFFLFFFCF